MKQINKYMLPKDTERLYKDEAISSITLSREVADKINELIDYVNELYKNDTEKALEMEGRIRKAVLYMKDNLSNSLVELLDIMKTNGELDSIIEKTMSDIKDEVEKQNIYYDNITVEKIHDTVADCDYYVTTIPKHDSLGNPIKLQMGLANDNLEGNTLESTLSFSHRKNATVCVNAGVYDVDTHYSIGTLIKDYRVIYEKTPAEAKYQFLGLKDNGEIRVYPYTTPASKMLADGMKDVICIFGALIKGGVPVLQTDLRADVRQSIGIKEDGTIIFISTDGRTRVNKGMSYDDLIRLHTERGSVEAHILDGGGSTSTIVEGIKINENIDYNVVDRKVHNFLYIVKDNQRGTYLYWGLKGPEDTAEKTNLFRIYPQGTWVQTYHGPSSDRPNGVVGLCFFDESIGKPIWYNGTEWVDSAGTKI